MEMLSSRRLVALACVCLAVTPLGCLPFEKKEAAAPRLTLLATLDSETYRPGEAVVATVTVTNDGTAPAESAGSLSADTLEFWFGPTGTDLRLRRDAVRSSREGGSNPVAILPQNSISRRFVLTRATEEEGEFAFHVFYSPDGNVPGKAGISGPAFVYRVDGQRLFRRDEFGLIRREDAIAIVKQEVGSGLKGAQARLVRNEAGFLDWWVRAEAVVNGQPVAKAFFVNPYTGTVRAEVKADAKPVAMAKEKTKASP